MMSHQEESKEFTNNEKSIIRQLTLKNAIISQSLANFTERPAERNIKGEVVHSGNSKIFCMCGKGDRSGRCFGGSDISQVVLSFFLINVPGIIFYTTTLDKIDQDWYKSVITRLQILCTFLMMITAFIDPGIIPKNEWDREAKLQIDNKYIKIRSNSLLPKIFYLMP
jgi:hypothetical protein